MLAPYKQDRLAPGVMSIRGVGRGEEQVLAGAEVSERSKDLSEAETRSTGRQLRAGGGHWAPGNGHWAPAAGQGATNCTRPDRPQRQDPSRHGRAPKPGHAQRAAASHGEVSDRHRPLLACPDGELCAGLLQTSDLDSRLSASHATHKLLDTAPSAASCVPA